MISFQEIHPNHRWIVRLNPEFEIIYILSGVERGSGKINLIFHYSQYFFHQQNIVYPNAITIYLPIPEYSKDI